MYNTIFFLIFGTVKQLEYIYIYIWGGLSNMMFLKKIKLGLCDLYFLRIWTYNSSIRFCTSKLYPKRISNSGHCCENLAVPCNRSPGTRSLKGYTVIINNNGQLNSGPFERKKIDGWWHDKRNVADKLWNEPYVKWSFGQRFDRDHNVCYSGIMVGMNALLPPEV